MGNIAVHAAPMPFSNLQVHMTAAPGASIADIVADILPERLIGKVDVVAQINGHIVFPKHWHAVRPKEGTIINIRAVPMGGGGGGKNTLALVLSVAVMIAAPYAAGALATNVALGVFGGGVATAGQVALTKGLLTAGFSILGQLAISALAPPPKPSNAGSVTESPTQMIEGASNTLSPYSVVPICLGTNRMVPLQAARPYTESQDNDNYVRQLFTWGYGAELVVSDLKIGDTPIESFSDFEVNHRLNGDLHEGTDLYSNDVLQQAYNILLSSADGYTERAVNPGTDEAIVDVTFPAGLSNMDNKWSNKDAYTVTLQIGYIATADLDDSSPVWTDLGTFSVTGYQVEALIRSYRIQFPSRGDYTIRIRKVTGDSGNDKIIDRTVLTAIKGVTYRSPVNLEGINGTAVRIRATDQLNGSIDQLNGIVSNLIPDYDADTETWITRATSNPASIYRYVLQGPANARPLADSRIRLEDLEAWHVYCEERGYTYNRVIDFDTSVEDVLADVASAGSASPSIVDGKRTVVVDRAKDDVVQIVTPRNSWGYQGEMIYPQLPHAFRVTFRNPAAGYQQDERIVYADGYNEENATLFETLDLPACTDPDLAYKTGRRMMAVARLRPETHTFSMDVENLVAIRGDRIKLEHDVPMVGLGDGRIKALDLDSSGDVLGVTLDDTTGIPGPGTYFMRIRYADGSQSYRQLTTVPGNATSFDFVEPIPSADAPAVGDLCYIVEGGGELDLIVTKIEPAADLTAKITALDYAPAIFDSETGSIPPFESRLSPPLEFQRPQAPVLILAQAGEDVLLRNPDGSFTSRAIFTLQNNNEGLINASVMIRPTGATLFTRANVLEATADRVILTGLQDGQRYDVWIRYQRAGSSVFSLPLQVNSFLYAGTSGPPADVTPFRISVTGSTAVLTWGQNLDVDLSHYRIKFSRVFTGASWTTAQLLQDDITQTQITIPFQAGTYLIKAVDINGNESVNATAIITYDPGVIANTVLTITESPTFPGVKEDTAVVGTSLVLADPDIQTGYYYFDQVVNLDDVFVSFVSAAILANGAFINNIFDIDDIFASPDLFGGAGNDIFGMSNLFAVDDIFGIGADAWAVTLEFSTTQEDPDDSGAEWTAWQEFTAGDIQFWGIRFRLKLEGFDPGVSPAVTLLSVTVDMPDRIERGNDLTVGDGSDASEPAVILFDPPFKTTPAVVITIQDGAADDKVEFLAKDADGFAFRVYNETVAGYVTRTYDYIASGYGRKNS